MKGTSQKTAVRYLPYAICKKQIGIFLMCGGQRKAYRRLFDGLPCRYAPRKDGIKQTPGV